MKKVSLYLCFLFIIIVIGTKFYECPEVGISVFGLKFGFNLTSFLVFKLLALGSWVLYLLIPEKKDNGS